MFDETFKGPEFNEKFYDSVLLFRSGSGEITADAIFDIFDITATRDNRTSTYVETLRGTVLVNMNERYELPKVRHGSNEILELVVTHLNRLDTRLEDDHDSYPICFLRCFLDKVILVSDLNTGELGGVIKVLSVKSGVGHLHIDIMAHICHDTPSTSPLSLIKLFDYLNKQTLVKERS